MSYTTINKSSLHMNTNIFTGNGGTQSITGVGFQPDMTWLKKRNGTANHHLVDAVRGVGYYLYPNLTNAQGGNGASLITSFNSDGFTMDSGADSNGSGSTGVGWSWKAGGTASANTYGSINSSVSVNATAGFSIATWTTPSSGTQFTIGHGLGQAPDMMMMKCTTQANSWFTYHKGLGGNVNDYLVLNETAAKASQTNMWGANGAETNTMGFKAGTSSYTNQPMVGYFFAEKQGYSKFGSYTGNGSASSGTFIYTGFKPAFVMIKNANNGSEAWEIFDTKRDTFNTSYKGLFPNSNSAELTNTAQNIDILSNGFKPRSAETRFNGSGNTIIYMAFAEAPLVGTNNVPCTAR